MKAGAELYGHSGIASDIEVISLMLRTLKVAGIESAQLALGHIGIYKTILDGANIDEDLESKLFAALQIKSDTEIKNLLADASLTEKQTRALGILATLHGDISILDTARKELSDDFPALTEHLDQLAAIAKAVSDNNPEQSLYFDLCELRGYDYHTGVVFAAYVSDHGEAIANGGRYDDIGEVFGRARPATGFDTDLKTLLSLGSREYNDCRCIYAPSENDDALKTTIQQLRSQGDKVIVALSDQTESASEMGCSFKLTKTSDGWQVKPV